MCSRQPFGPLDDLHPIARECLLQQSETLANPNMTARQAVEREGIVDDEALRATATIARAGVASIAAGGDPEIVLLAMILLGIRLARKGIV